MFHSLDPEKIIGTLETLMKRIHERFPGSGLEQVSRDLTDITRITSQRVEQLARPNYTMRAIVVLILLAGVGSLAWLAWKAHDLETSTELTNIMQGIDSATSLLIVLGGGALFLSTFEGRWRRDRAMKGLHELRSLIH